MFFKTRDSLPIFSWAIAWFINDLVNNWEDEETLSKVKEPL